MAGSGRLSNIRAPQIVGAFGKRIFYTAGYPGRSMWVSDGTSKGTISFGNLDVISGMEWAGNFYFTIRATRTDSTKLLVTDGTSKGPKLVKALGVFTDAHPVAAGIDLFLTTGCATPLAIWRSDGTAKGTFEVSSSADSETLPRRFGNQLVFARAAGGSPRTGVEPWVTDGTKNGTRLLRDVYPGMDASSPAGFTALPGGYVAFSANDGSARRELWASDGSRRNTWRVADLDPRQPPTGSSDVRLAGSHAGLAVLQSGSWGQKIWVTDGTGAGTVCVDSEKGFGDVSTVALGADILFGTGTRAIPMKRFALMRTDGTRRGTSVTHSFTGNSGPRALTRLGRYVYFSASDGASATGLWRTDGTTAGTVFGKNLSPDQMVTFRGALYFITHVFAGIKLYRSDGTAAGTVLLGGAIPSSRIPKLFKTDRYVYAAGWLATLRTDGKAAVKVRDKSGSTWFRVDQLVGMGGVDYFIGSGPASFGLWRTDGTGNGTYLVKRLARYFRWFDRDLSVVGRTLFFLSGTSRSELWTSDGTAAGTGKVAGAPQQVYATWRGPTLVAVGDWLYFSGDDGVHGAELWRTDGTAAQTKMVYDLAPGRGSSWPYGFTLSGGALLFAADDAFHGFEPHRVEVPAHAELLGDGCAPGVIPRLRATPPQLNKTVRFDVADVGKVAGTVGLLAIGWPPSRPRLMGGGCTFYLDRNQPLLRIPFRPVSGSWSIQIRVPGRAVLHGIDLAAQVVTGPTAQPPYGFDLSNGLLLALRR